MENKNKKNLKCFIARLDAESFAQKYKEIRFKIFRVYYNIFRNNNKSKEMQEKITELSIIRELLECELVSRQDLNLEKKINQMEEEFLEENEIDFENRLGPMIDDLGDAGIIDSEQLKLSLRRVLEDWNKEIIERYIEIEVGITLDKTPKGK